MTNAIISALNDAREKRVATALCTVVKTTGSTPLKSGASMLVREDGTSVGTIGGGALEYAVIADAAKSISSNTSSLIEHRLVPDHNMCCGGTVEVFINPIPVRNQLFLFGAGHVNRALAQHAALLEFEISVIDDRPEMFLDWPVADVRIFNNQPRDVIDSLVFDARTYVMIATHSHPLDREVLRLCLHKPHAYLGMIGSKRKAAVTRALFIDQQWATEEEFAAIDLPAGLNINAESPQEIAVSMAARMVEVGNSHSKNPESRIRNPEFTAENDSLQACEVASSVPSFVTQRSSSQ